MKKTSLLISALIIAMSLTGCGGSKTGSAERAMKANFDSESYAAAEEAVAYEDYADGEMMEASSVNTGAEAEQVNESAAATTNRKLIRTVNLSVETLEYEEVINSVKAKVTQLGGYFESMNEYRNSYGVNDTRSANMTIRIPKANADTLLTSLEEKTNVTSYGENMEDVTLAYVDMDSHKKALQSEEERLMQLMEKAESIEDLIVIEQRLSDVRYQIESMESQLRTYDNKVEYTTIYLDVREVERITPVAEPGFFSRIGAGFSESLYDVIQGLLNFIIGFISAIPHLIVWGIILTALFFAGRAILRKIKNPAKGKAGKKVKPQIAAKAESIAEKEETVTAQEEKAADETAAEEKTE